MHGRLRRSEARRQHPPGTATDQHVDDGGKHRLIVDIGDPATLRPHPSRRQQRPGDLPQAIRNDPSPIPVAFGGRGGPERAVRTCEASSPVLQWIERQAVTVCRGERMARLGLRSTRTTSDGLSLLVDLVDNRHRGIQSSAVAADGPLSVAGRTADPPAASQPWRPRRHSHRPPPPRRHEQQDRAAQAAGRAESKRGVEAQNFQRRACVTTGKGAYEGPGFAARCARREDTTRGGGPAA